MPQILWTDRYKLSLPWLLFTLSCPLSDSISHCLVYSGVICVHVCLPHWTVILKEQELYFIPCFVPIMNLICCLTHSRYSGDCVWIETLSLTSSLKWGTGVFYMIWLLRNWVLQWPGKLMVFLVTVLWRSPCACVVSPRKLSDRALLSILTWKGWLISHPFHL